ncbi:hypothetical protein Ancab_004343, partial [Ancistrocladus abbreviatus]
MVESKYKVFDRIQSWSFNWAVARIVDGRLGGFSLGSSLGESIAVLVWKGYGDQCHNGLNALDPPQTSSLRSSGFTQRKVGPSSVKDLSKGLEGPFVAALVAASQQFFWWWSSTGLMEERQLLIFAPTTVCRDDHRGSGSLLFLHYSQTIGLQETAVAFLPRF